MISVVGLGIGLSVLLSLLAFALLAEVYYFLWWKRNNAELDDDVDNGGNCGSKVFHLLRREHSSTSSSTSQTLIYSNESALGHGINDSQVKIVDEESVESELKRVHNLTVPTRFLSTIEEETKDDIAEVEDGKSREERRRKGSRSRSLGDALMAVEPPLKASGLNPMVGLYELHSLNPLFEADSEMYSLKSSPPSTLKFLRDAEDKYFRKLSEGACSDSESSTMVS